MRIHARSLGMYKPASHVDNLPDEILREILLRTLPRQFFEMDLFVSPRCSIVSPVHLSHVSRRWRGICLSTGELWSYLYLVVNESTARQYRKLIRIFDVFLERTGRCLLNFRLECRLSNKETIKAGHHIISIILTQQRRWKDVQFLWQGLNSSYGFGNLQMNDMPLLRTLVVDISMCTAEGALVYPKLYLEKSQQLEALVVRNGVALEFGETPKYRLSKCAVNIPLKCMKIASPRICRDILRSSPNLQSLDFRTGPDMESPSLESGEGNMLLHRGLKKLDLRYGLSSEFLIDGLCLPSLEDFYYVDGSLGTGGNALLRFVQRSRPALTSFTIHGTYIRGALLIEVLRHLPTITELTLLSCPLNASFIHAFEIPNDTAYPPAVLRGDVSVLCPRLRSLHISCSSFYQDFELPLADALNLMIESRRRNLKTLNKITVHAAPRRVEYYAPLDREGIGHLKSCLESGRIVCIDSVEESPFSTTMAEGLRRMKKAGQSNTSQVDRWRNVKS
ncbi:hypothetical protein ACEPAH_8409 [Sanghuangporus vaninii]